MANPGLSVRIDEYRKADRYMGVRMTDTVAEPSVGGVSKVDPFTLEIIKNKLDRAADEGGVALVLTAGSILIAEAQDYCVGLYSADGHLVAGGAGFVAVLPAAGRAIRHVIETYSADPGIDEGDMFIVNDPYVGAVHAPDGLMIAPCFVDGERVGFACGFVHMADVGGVQPGGWHTEATESFQEGFQTGGLKLIERGKPRRDVWDTLLNQVRFPDRVALDLRSIIAACNVARDRYLKIFETYGKEVTLAATALLVDRSEYLLRARLRELPDGEWSARLYFDYHGDRGEAVYPVVLTLRKERDQLRFDFTGTHEQLPLSINCSLGLTFGCVIGPLYIMLGWDIPINEGMHRCVEIHAPTGTLVNPARPAPVSCDSEALGHIIQNLTAMVASKMLGASHKHAHRVTAQWGSHGVAQMFGFDADNNFVTEATTDLFGSSAGAQSFKDGVDVGGEMGALTTRTPNTETSEMYFPARFLYKRIVPDSGGPGKYRGGTIIEWAMVPHGTLTGSFEANMFSGRGVTFPQSQGIFGGLPGCTTDYVQYRDSNAAEYPASRADTEGREEHVRWGPTHIGADDVMYLRNGGGGGFGDPLDRDPQLVARDVGLGMVSRDAALSVYGVAVNGIDEVEVDEAKTSQQRSAMRRERLGGDPPVAADARRPPPLSDRPLGGYLQVAELADGPSVQCTWCATRICAAGESWKDHAVRREAPLAEAGPVHRDSGECILREHICPGCATLLDVELARPDDPPLVDRVSAWPGA
jgi:N-methylhydantoinase B